jgi:hypothetical protein
MLLKPPERLQEPRESVGPLLAFGKQKADQGV